MSPSSSLLRLALVLSVVPVASALEWDTDSVNPGAQGAAVSPSSWNLANAFWWNGSANVGWVPSQSAVFGGTAGVVQLASAITARDFVFNTGNFPVPASSFAGAYEIKGSATGGHVLTLSSDSAVSDYPDITVASGVRALFSFTLGGFDGNVGFVKRGAGTLILQHNTTAATSQLNGAIEVSEGRLLFDSTVPTTLLGSNSLPSLNSVITVRSGASLQLDRSHVLGGAPATAQKRIRVDLGGSLYLANARQYLAEIDLAGILAEASRETTSAGIDEGDASALLTPVGGLLFRCGGSDVFVENTYVPFEVREGPLTFLVANGLVAEDFIVSGAIRSPDGSTQDVIKNGPGTLRLASANTFQGDLVVNAGLLRATVSDALGEATVGGAGEVRVNAGGAIDLFGRGNTKNKSWIIAGHGPDGAGAILNGSGNLTDDSRIVNLTLAADASLGGIGNFDIGWNRSTNSVGGIVGAGHTLTKRGSGEVRVRAASSNIAWDLAGGTLTAMVNNAFGSGEIDFTTGSTLRGLGNVTIPNALSLVSGTLGAEAGLTTFTGLISHGTGSLGIQTPAGASVAINNNIVGVKGGPGIISKNGEGTVFFNGTLAAANVNAGTVRGTGTVTASLNVSPSATLAPGNNHGALTINAGFNLQGKIAFAINGVDSARLVVNGNLTISPAATLELSVGNTYTQPLYILVEYDQLIGSFVSLPKPPAGYAFDLNQGGLNRIALVATASDPFASWASAKGLVGADALPLADPDADGIVNILEFVLGAEPSPAAPGSASAQLLPVLEVASATHVTFTFRRASAATAVEPVVRFGSDLANPAAWSTAVHGSGGVTLAITTNHYGPGIDRVVATLPRDGAPRLFARLQATLP